MLSVLAGLSLDRFFGGALHGRRILVVKSPRGCQLTLLQVALCAYPASHSTGGRHVRKSMCLSKLGAYEKFTGCAGNIDSRTLPSRI